MPSGTHLPASPCVKGKLLPQGRPVTDQPLSGWEAQSDEEIVALQAGLAGRFGVASFPGMAAQTGNVGSQDGRPGAYETLAD
ncbi:hypothetical protein [Acetobacter indonesiensis]|uniref:hypothetical protein n=1 Tax=Acetobacter indonesiensis TaxID=104101 RepID=UPI0015C4EACA|nr:hypothetical protein [Acetobacter indonesiensis]